MGLPARVLLRRALYCLQDLSRAPALFVALIGIAQNLGVNSGVGLQLSEDSQVVVLVHEQHEYLLGIVVVVVNFEPVGLGFSKSDRALRCVLVGALVDLGVRNSHRIAFGGVDFDCLVIIAKVSTALTCFPFRLG